MLFNEIKDVINNEIIGTGSIESVINSLLFLNKINLLDDKVNSYLINNISKHKNIKSLNNYINSDKFLIDFKVKMVTYE